MFYIDNSESAFLTGDNTLFLYGCMAESQHNKADRSDKR